MEDCVQIFEMSNLLKEDILKQIIKLLNDNQIEKFTVLVKLRPLPNQQKKSTYSFNVDEVTNIRPKSSTIDKYYKSNKFLNHQKSISQLLFDLSDPIDEDKLPQSPKDLGIKLYKAGEYDKAVQIFQQLRQQFPAEYREIINCLGNSYFQTKQYQEAIQIFKMLISQFDSEPNTKQEIFKGQLYNNLGCCYGKLGFQKLSMNSYRQALQLYSRHCHIDLSVLLNNIANIYFNCGMHQIAEKYYLDAINERKLKNPEGKHLLYYAYYKMSLAQVQQHKYKQAFLSLEIALELARNNFGDVGQILQQCALIKELQNQWEQALEFYQEMYLLNEAQGKSKGYIFQKVAKVYLNLKKFVERQKYVKLSLQQYKKQGNTKKVCEISKGHPSLIRDCMGV